MRRLLVAGAFALLAASLASSTAAFATTANDEITGAISIGPVPYSTSVDFAGATYAETDPVCPEKAAEDRLAYPSLWYKITPTIGGRIDAHLAPSGTDWHASIGVYTGSPGSLQQQACADDTYYNQNEGRSVAGFVATAGTTYYVAVSAYSLRDPVAYTLELTLPSWHDWASLGGSVMSYPDCHQDAGGIGCWARSAAAQLVENDGPATGPRSWTTIGGSIAGSPTCPVRTARTDCFASTSLNRLAWITYSGATWGSWIDLGANASGQPYCLLVGVSGIDCYAGGTDHAVRRWSYSGASWKAPVKITGASTVSRVTCVTRSGTDCFYLDSSGNAWTFHVSTTGNAGAPKKIGTGFGLPPVCVSSGSGKLDCFAQSKAHTLLKGYFNGTSWAAWSNLGGNVASDAACTETLPGPNPDFDCFWTNGLGHMVERARQGGVWQAEQDLGGSIQQKPACTLNGGRKDCFARGLDNALWQRSYY